MKLLLDTHVLLWAAGYVGTGPRLLPAAAEALIRDEDNALYFSAASIWEVAIKHTLQRPDFIIGPRLLRRGLLDNGYTEIAVTGEHAVAVASLPALHKDPFDRVLVAQAVVEGAWLVTADALVSRYRGPIRRV